MTDEERDLVNRLLDLATNQVRAELGADVRRLAGMWRAELRGLRNEVRALAGLPPLPPIETEGEGDRRH